MATKTENRAKEQARTQLDSIIEMVKRLEHCQEGCKDREDCELREKVIIEGLGFLYTTDHRTPTDEEWGQYHNEDEARQAIEEGPLSIEVRSDWHTPDTAGDSDEFMILLCTGGPAVRITGGLDSYCQPDSARLEYQDWFTPWEHYLDTTSEEDEALLAYCQSFYFGD